MPGMTGSISPRGFPVALTQPRYDPIRSWRDLRVSHLISLRTARSKNYGNTRAPTMPSASVKTSSGAFPLAQWVPFVLRWLLRRGPSRPSPWDPRQIDKYFVPAADASEFQIAERSARQVNSHANIGSSSRWRRCRRDVTGRIWWCLWCGSHGEWSPCRQSSRDGLLGHRLSTYLSDGSAARLAHDLTEPSDSDFGAMLLSIASEARPLKSVMAMAFVSALKSTCFGSIMWMSESDDLHCVQILCLDVLVPI